MGVPAIACKGGWSADQLERLGPEFGLICEFNKDSLAEAMMEAIDRTEEFQENRSKVSARIRAEHGADPFAAVIFAP